jgi:hypothetical protein
MGEISEIGTKAASRRPGEGLGQTAIELAERIDEILKLAERTAAEVQQEAEASAERYLAERRAEADREIENRVGEANRALAASATAIAELSTSLREQAERVLEDVTKLERAAQAALARLPGETAPSSKRTQPAAPAGETGAGDGSPPAEPLLRAAQMAIQGHSREEIERTLRADFGISSPEEIVGEILGARGA